MLGDAPAGDVLLRDRIDEASLAERCVSPLNEGGHNFASKTVVMRAFLDPKAEFRRDRTRIFKLGHAKAFPVIQPPDDERELVRL